MFEITWLPRTTTRDAWRKVWRIARRHDRSYRMIADPLQERQRLHDLIEDAAHWSRPDERVAINVTSMDCDCAVGSSPSPIRFPKPQSINSTSPNSPTMTL